jgi:hypothetical protein
VNRPSATRIWPLAAIRKICYDCAMLWRLVPSGIIESVGGPRSASVGTVSLGTGKLLPLKHYWPFDLLSYVSRFDVIDALLDHVSNDESCPEHASLVPRCNRDLNICALASLSCNEMQLRYSNS